MRNYDNDEVNKKGYYRRTSRRPEEITNYAEFYLRNRIEYEHINDWIPRKHDIRKYIKTLRVVREKTGRQGPIKVVDIGGGSGFLAKLIADEAAAQGVEIELVVMDPSRENLQDGRQTYGDNSNIKFEEGTAHNAVSRYGPKLSPVEQQQATVLDSQVSQRLHDAQEELGKIKVLQDTLEAHKALYELPVDHKDLVAARELLSVAGIDTSRNSPASVKRKLANLFEKRWHTNHEEILSLRDSLEQIYTKHVLAHPDSASFDAVISSWMPGGIDLTREIRMLGAPTIIYAREKWGSTGIGVVASYKSDTLGEEESFGTGKRYTEVDEWQGVATSTVETLDKKKSDTANVSKIQVRRDIDLSAADIVIGEVPDTEKYRWEASLEQVIPETNMRELQFEYQLDPTIKKSCLRHYSFPKIEKKSAAGRK